MKLHMSSVNDSPNHFVMPDAISRKMKSVGMIAKVMIVKDHSGEGGKYPRLAAPRGDCRRQQEGEKQ
jgi:hypothetical protein